MLLGTIQSQENVRSCTVPAVFSVIAHQGGWDEILLIAGPMIAIGWLLVIAKRRVDAAAEKQKVSDSPRDAQRGV